MANCYTIITAEDGIACSAEDYEKLDQLLKGEEDWSESGLQLEHDGEELYAYTESFFDSDSLEEAFPAFLELLGQVIANAGKEFWEWGVAFTCNKQRPGSHGGNLIRIYADGQLVWADQVFSYTPRPLLEARATWESLRKETHSEDPVWRRHEWQLEAFDGDTQLGYWDWVWHQIESNEQR
jgi:hypothetical protein